MTSRYDITKHIDYENHMKDYIKKTEAMRIIDNLKTQLHNMPIQSHPDYKPLLTMLAERHAREMSKLEKELRAKLQGPKQQEPKKNCPACPPTPSCPSCPNCPAPKPSVILNESPRNNYTVTATTLMTEPVAASNYLVEMPESVPTQSIFSLPWRFF